MAKNGLTKKQKQRRRRVARINADPIYNPGSPLSGLGLKKTAGALTQISTRPAIQAQKTQLGASKRAQKQDVKAIGRMGKRLDEQAGTLTQKLGQYGNEGIANAQGYADSLSDRLAATNQSATDNLNRLQSDALGGSIAALVGQDIPAGQSAGQEAMERMAALQQQGQSDLNTSWAGLGAVLGEAGVKSAAGLRQAGLQDMQNQRLAIQRNITSRQVDRRAQGTEERIGARTQLATLRGLKGAEKLKNLLELRREQQSYMNEKAGILAQTRQANADRKLDWYEAITGAKNDAAAIAQRERDSKRDANGDGGGGGGADLWDKEGKLSKPEFNQAKAAALDILGGKGSVRNWNEFLDRVGAQEGVSWSPVERKKFKRRFKKKFPDRV